jgi:predicted nucleic acid-binding protein
MSGKRCLLDTNAIVQLLSGNNEILELLAGAEFVATSVICELEFLSFSGWVDADRTLFQTMIQRIKVVDVSHDDDVLKEMICSLRTVRKLKLPDAIIAASALTHDCTLITADQKLLNTPGLKSMGFAVT